MSNCLLSNGVYIKVTVKNLIFSSPKLNNRYFQNSFFISHFHINIFIHNGRVPELKPIIHPQAQKVCVSCFMAYMIFSKILVCSAKAPPIGGIIPVRTPLKHKQVANLEGSHFDMQFSANSLRPRLDLIFCLREKGIEIT